MFSNPVMISSDDESTTSSLLIAIELMCVLMLLRIQKRKQSLTPLHFNRHIPIHELIGKNNVLRGEKKQKREKEDA